MKFKIGKKKFATGKTNRPSSVAQRKAEVLKQEQKVNKKKPAVDPVRERNVRDVQTETHRLLSAVDHKRKYGSVKGLAQTADIIRCCYTLIDMAEEGQ